LPGDVRQDLVPVLQLDTEHGVRQRLGDRSLHQDRVVLLLGQKASLPSNSWRVETRKTGWGRLKSIPDPRRERKPGRGGAQLQSRAPARLTASPSSEEIVRGASGSRGRPR